MNKSQEEINRENHIALFGDPETGKKGVVQMTTEMYELLSTFRLFGKAVMWIALVVGSVGTAIAGYFQLIRHFFTKQ